MPSPILDNKSACSDDEFVCDDDFAASILAGLKADKKTIESKWFYDAEGSRLFDAITQLQEYYPTRVETGILKKHSKELSSILPAGTALVELGSGSSVKTRLVLDALPAVKHYVPVDISREHLESAADNLAADYPGIDISPLVADFTSEIVLPPAFADVPKLLFFPGSTIGNFGVGPATELLRRLHKMQNVIAFVIGFDRIKSEATLVRAYDDKNGVTAAFNLNLLTRINRELGADFDLEAFRHEARWNKVLGRIEMHLVSKRHQSVHLLGERISFENGETIHTENSHKYTPDGFKKLNANAGWKTQKIWSDDQAQFSVAVLRP